MVSESIERTWASHWTRVEDKNYYMNDYEINVILQPNHKNYNGRRYLKMKCTASSREEAVERAKGYMSGMLQDYVILIVN